MVEEGAWGEEEEEEEGGVTGEAVGGNCGAGVGEEGFGVGLLVGREEGWGKVGTGDGWSRSGSHHCPLQLPHAHSLPPHAPSPSPDDVEVDAQSVQEPASPSFKIKKKKKKKKKEKRKKMMMTIEKEIKVDTEENQDLPLDISIHAYFKKQTSFTRIPSLLFLTSFSSPAGFFFLHLLAPVSPTVEAAVMVLAPPRFRAPRV